MIDWINNFSTIGHLESDSVEIKIQKSFLVFLAVFMSMGGILWGSITLYNGLFLPSSIPLGYVICSAVNMLYFKWSKNFARVRFVQVFISLILPFLFQGTLGGYYPSGAIMLWSILALVASLSFQDVKSSLLWLVLFIIATLITSFFDDYFFSIKPEILADQSLLFLTINLSVISSIFFGLVLYFVVNHRKARAKLKESTDQMLTLNFDLQKNLEEKRKAIADLENARTKLVESDKMASLGLLSASIGHEINNPLGHIKGGVLGLSKSIEINDDDTKAFIDIVNDGVNRVAEIVTSLSHFSRNVEKMDEQCDVHKIIENCLVILNNKLKHKVEVIKEFSEQNLILKGNQGRLHQAFLNIISNAEQAIESNGTLLIRTELSDKILVSIKDSGSGMTEETMSKIMEPFFTTKEAGHGTGLGLPITRQIIEEHNGDIEIKSDLGVGSEFRITIPFLKTQ